MSSTSAEPRAFTDTNILVYAYDGTAGEKRRRAGAVIEDLLESRRGCVSIQVLQELFVTLTRKLQQSLDSRAAAAVVEAFGTWTTHTPDADDVLAAIELHERFRVSFWDAMILHSAVTLGCGTLYTEDLNAGQRYDGVLVVDPFSSSS